MCSSRKGTPLTKSALRAVTARRIRSATRLRETSVDAQAALWAAVLASGVYHGLNPGMGWPLAVAAGLTERRGTAVARTLVPLAAGHLVSIAVVLLPFAALTVLLDWSREIRIAAGLVIVGFSGVLLLYPRHPRW